MTTTTTASTTENLNTWIIGCGNIGQRISLILQKKGEPIKATSHSNSSACALKKIGISVFEADLDKPSTLNALPLKMADIFYFAPPPKQRETDTRMSHFLGSLDTSASPRRIVYISTTGVYGNHNGEWITEKMSTAPNNARSKRRLHAEKEIKQFCLNHKTEYVILRVTGIYDLAKLPLARINAGLKVLDINIAPSSNRIHAADLANICIAAMQSPHYNCVFNVADGNPSSISDYFIQTAKLFKLKMPEEINWTQAINTLSPDMLSYLSESKKIDASSMLKKLDLTLQYPNLAEGLAACKKEYDALKPA